MPSRTPIEPRDCHIANGLTVLSDRWTILILREVLFFDSHRFEEFVRYTGASRDIIADRLRKLVDAGMLHRHAYNDAANRYEYLATDKGEATREVIEAVGAFGRRFVTPGLLADGATP